MKILNRGLAQILSISSGAMNEVYLSDGGHYENLAVYELIRRECETIYCFDVGEDPEWKLEDLHQLVKVTSKPEGRLPKGHPGWYCKYELEDLSGQSTTTKSTDLATKKTNQRILKIRYTKYNIADEEKKPKEGTIWLVKATMIGDEPASLYLFSLQNPSFPHHSTSNQFFDSLSFAAYRDLGYWSAKKLIDFVQPDKNRESPDQEKK